MPASSSAASPPRRRKHAAAEPSRNALTPERWIEAATEVLVEHGIDSVRVDMLAHQLKVTRGSFYWHFRDREDLLRRLLQAWRERATEQLTARLESAHTDPAEQLRDVISLPFRGRAAQRAARIELSLRAWARRDAMARQVVDEADASRIGYIAQIFSSLGFPIAEARARAFLLYTYVVGESQLAQPGSAAQRSTFVERLMRTPVA